MCCPDSIYQSCRCHELRNPLNAISNSAELLGESLSRFFSRYDEMKKDPALANLIAPLEADMRDDLEAVETILLSSRHQKRIADGECEELCFSVVAVLLIWLDRFQMCCTYPRLVATWSSLFKINGDLSMLCKT